jgi:iron complex transport system ATP-binding protein
VLPVSVAAAVEAHEIVLAYGRTVAIRRSSFAVPSGSVTAVIGPNGSGKSTMLNAIAGLVEPVSGTIHVTVSEPGTTRIAYVLQTTKVSDTLPISVREVVTMGRYAGNGFYKPLTATDREAVEAAMERTGIVDLGGKHLQELSGGQRQRVFVAQGLAQDHDILMLDEPLTGLDLPTAQAIDEVIHDERGRGCTVIMTTHDLSEARVADYVLLLSGRVVASGTPDEVLTARNLAEAYGESLLHLEEGQLFVDDPAHIRTRGDYVSRERTIHPETVSPDRHSQ